MNVGQIETKDYPKVSPVAKVKPPERNTTMTMTTTTTASTTKKDSPKVSPVAKAKPSDRNTTTATPAAALTTKKKHEPLVNPVRSEKEPVRRVNAPIFKSLEQRKPTSVDEKEVCLISLPTK